MTAYSPTHFIRLVLLAVSAIFVFLSAPANSQSTDQAFPTAITENQLAGRIKARDIGDARLTTYYYTFNGAQGDLFVNIVTKNLSGSIDVFAADGMRSLTKIVVYADLSQNETGRVIYLRKPEKLILRVEGRTPNDEIAEFQIKFAGGFEAAIPSTDEPPVPKVTDVGTNESGVRVNSVGTIIAVTPRPRPTPKSDAAIASRSPEKTETRPVEDQKIEPEEEPDQAMTIESETTNDTAEPKTEEPAKPAPKRTAAATSRRNRARTPGPKSVKTEPTSPTETENPIANANSPAAKRPPKVIITENITPKADPLANVNLVIVFKDGRKVERPMSEVLRFTADQTTLTVIGKNGRTAKFSIFEVASVTIQ